MIVLCAKCGADVTDGRRCECQRERARLPSVFPTVFDVGTESPGRAERLQIEKKSYEN